MKTMKTGYMEYTNTTNGSVKIAEIAAGDIFSVLNSPMLIAVIVCARS